MFASLANLWTGDQLNMTLPIFIVCHNNGWMVRNTVEALAGRFKGTQLVIVDEASTAPRTIETLRELEANSGVVVHRHRRNVGPKRVRKYPRYWGARRRPFVLTDPDLEFSTLPADTLEVFKTVAEDQDVRCVGVALDISDPDDIVEGPYCEGKTVLEWESRFWQEPVDLSGIRPELVGYRAPVDTTFAYYDLSRPKGRTIRIAGPYTVRHLPWHKSYFSTLDDRDYRDYFMRVTDRYSTAKVLRRMRKQAEGKARSGSD